MLFNSWEFIVLFIATAILYFNTSYSIRIVILFFSSYLFYTWWRLDFAGIMLAVTIINYFIAKIISKKQDKPTRKIWLFLAIGISLIPLLYFKYFNFFIENINQISSTINSTFTLSYHQLILPVGISFFTFQALSYTIDVYNKKTPVEHNLIRYGTFVAFFPQLVAGPIERSSNLLAQLRQKHDFKLQNLIDGSKLFIWGLFKKVVIADRLALYVDKVFDTPELYSGPTLVIAVLFFAFQIYCDFSGYSDMAIGTARILGFKLMQNFNLPYFATSIADFWKRWHISLSSWFGDYVYRPLGGNRVPYIKWIRNILVVFLVSGFWHGAQWTFIIWGLVHAFLYFIERWGDTFMNQLKINGLKNTFGYICFKRIFIFISVCYAWIFFRANSVTDAFQISKKIWFDWENPIFLGSSTVTFIVSCLSIFLLIGFQIMQHKGISSIYFSKSKMPNSIQFFWYILLLLGISLLGVSSNSFIYFQF